MLVANAVVDTDQPRLQVGENQMDDRQVLLGNLWITTLGNSEVLIAALTEASIAAGARLSMTHLDGTGDGNLVVNTTAFPTRSPANPGFVHLNMVLGLSTDRKRSFRPWNGCRQAHFPR